MFAIRASFVSLVIAVLVALALVSPASASNALFSCTKDPSAVYICDQQPAVGQHIQLNTVPGACHVNVNQLRQGAGGAKLADVTVAHNLNCPWATGSLKTITYTAPTSPAVGGIMGLIDAPPSPPLSPAAVSPLPMGLLSLAGAAATALIGTLAALALIRRQIKIRPVRGAGRPLPSDET